MAVNYWTYWVHRVQQLWEKVEALERKVAAMESGAAVSPSADPPLAERELTVCMVLKEMEAAASLEAINGHLKKSRMIEEDMKQTLVARLKGAVEKGYVSYNTKTKQFSLVKTRFVVE